MNLSRSVLWQNLIGDEEADKIKENYSEFIFKD